MTLSPLEIELGFQVIEVLGVCDPYAENPIDWVAKVLGESDIVIRIGDMNNPTYQHQRFGRFDNLPTSPAGWHPISNLFGGHASDPRQVICDAQFGADEIGKQIIVLPIKADIRY